MEIDLSIRKVNIKEIKFIQMSTIDGKDKELAMRKTLKWGSDLSDEEIENLSVKDGIAITKAINDLNGFSEQTDFPKL